MKVVAWYDNEWGYSNRLVDLAQRVLVPVACLSEPVRGAVPRHCPSLAHEPWLDRGSCARSVTTRSAPRASSACAPAGAVDGDHEADAGRAGRLDALEVVSNAARAPGARRGGGRRRASCRAPASCAAARCAIVLPSMRSSTSSSSPRALEDRLGVGARRHDRAAEPRLARALEVEQRAPSTPSRPPASSRSSSASFFRLARPFTVSAPGGSSGGPRAA